MKVTIKDSSGQWHTMCKIHPRTYEYWNPDEKGDVLIELEKCSSNSMIAVGDGDSYVPVGCIAELRFD